MNLGKRRLKALLQSTVASDVLEHFGYEFQNSCPETWHEFEKRIFDVISETEHQMHEKIEKILGEKHND